MEIKIWTQQKGEMLFLWVTILILFVMLGTIVMEAIRTRGQLSVIRNRTESIIKASIIKRWDEVFGGVREGYSGAYHYNNYSKKWEDVLTDTNLLPSVYETLGLNTSGEKEDNSSKGYQYKIKKIKTDDIRVSFQNKSQVLTVKGKVFVEMIFYSSIPFTVEVPLEVIYQKLF